ncbi:MAG TPA: 4-hydroxy-tetrahydrodipicolinate synthase [Bradyrhizobium sp.]|uniref:4-hydroxy-tetrahydrodipicolinate synthase family protein n=1 Tax=Bradyrhizobium sp. TaxID=376 RepID=UPI002C4B7684|nr:4-hydroxy-tetrahydrodipicolinate synthase [Bradyrhizobium sp.]HLZ06225.1 4-hydroxy-tetrahydrodipicolinate synthase [Bradyrhizobium sp.]
MNELRDCLRGLWLPLVTPFRDGALDEVSLRRLVRHYANGPIDGFILGATSGEGLMLATDEMEHLVTAVRSELAALPRILPICLGLAGASTQKMQEMLDETAAWPIDGYLISAPYYLRPSQRGLLAHFTALADHASWPIVLYNIPYRTSVNITTDTLLRLAQHPSIVGMKDCSADRAQSIDLIRRRPEGFRVLTGEDADYIDALCDGADGAILLAAHVETEAFARVQTRLKAGDRDGASACWQDVAELTRLLFAEPSPAPAKYWLKQTGLIASAEVRSPMVEVSAELATWLDREIARRSPVRPELRLVNAE